MCHVKIYTKQCTTCQTTFKDVHNRDNVYVEQHPCPYVLANGLGLAGCGQRTRQERCGRMDYGECPKCIEDMWMSYGDDNLEGGGGGGGGYSMGRDKGYDRTPRGGKEDNDRGQGGSGEGGSGQRGGQSVSTDTRR